MKHVFFIVMTVAIMTSMSITATYAVGETYRLTAPTTNVFGTTGVQVGKGGYMALSADGRFLAYSLSKKEGSPYIIYVRDRMTGATIPLQPRLDGTPITGYPSAISADGRFVAFSSETNNLIPNDTNDESDAFVSDRVTGITRRVSVASDGTQISGCGSINTAYEIFRCGSYAGDISADGRWVGFETFSRDLFPDTAQQLSATARRLGSTDYSDRFIYIYDQMTGKVRWVDAGGKMRMSADARFTLLTAGGLPAYAFVHDRLTGQETEVSVASNGKHLVCKNPRNELDPGCDGSFGMAISDDGRFVLFYSDLNNQQPGCDGSDGIPSWQIYLHDRTNKHTRCLFSQAYKDPSTEEYDLPANVRSAIFNGDLSANGRYAVFNTAQPLLVNDTNHRTDSYLYDRISQQFERISVGNNGKEKNWAYGGAISADGRQIAFVGNNVLSEDHQFKESIYLRDRLIQPEHNADLSVHFEGTTAVVDNAEFYAHSYADTAENTVLSFRIQPARPNIVYRLQPSQGYCEPGPIQICHLGNLQPGGRATVQANLIKAPPHLKTVTAYVDVSAAPKDSNPLDNSARATLPR